MYFQIPIVSFAIVSFDYLSNLLYILTVKHVIYTVKFDTKVKGSMVNVIHTCIGKHRLFWHLS